MLRLIAPIWRRLPDRVNWWLLGLMHARSMVSVVGVVFDGQGRVLALQHRFWNGRGWGLPGGYARHGERLEAALTREVYEETGYLINDIRLLHVRSGLLPWVEVVFRAQLIGGAQRLDRREILAARFCPPEDLPDNIPASYRAMIQQLTAFPRPISDG